MGDYIRADCTGSDYIGGGYIDGLSKGGGVNKFFLENHLTTSLRFGIR